VSSRFVGRKHELEKFRTILNDNKSTIYRIIGKPGIGKTWLIDKFREICKSENHPYTYVSFDTEDVLVDGIDFLQDLVSRTSCCFGTIQDGTINAKNNEVWWSHFVSAVTETKFGKIADGAFKSAVALYGTLSNKEAQTIADEAKKTPELFLLNILSSMGDKHPVIFLDTYEHLFSDERKINSCLDFTRSISYEYEKKSYKLIDHVNRLIEHLQKRGWIIVQAGRNMLHGEKADDLKPFSDEDILSFASGFDDLKPYITDISSDAALKTRQDSEEKLLKILKSLSFGGNPLWLSIGINLLQQLLKENSLEELASDTHHLQECFEKEEDDPFSLNEYQAFEHSSCKLRILEKLSHDTFDGDSAWKIALPLSLNQEIVSILYGEDNAKKIIKRYHIAGIFSTKSRDNFTLHEEIRDLLLAYAKSRSYLKSEDTRALYRKLKDHVVDKNRDSKNELWMREASYYAVMGSENLVNHKVEVDVFWSALGGLVFFSFADKWRVADTLEEATLTQIESILKMSDEESSGLIKVLGKEVTQQLKDDFLSVKIQSFFDIPYWKDRVKRFGNVGDYIALSYCPLDEDSINIYKKEMLNKFGESQHESTQEQCARALVNKGFTLGQMGKNSEAIEAYEEVVKRYGESRYENVREQCNVAKANMVEMLILTKDKAKAVRYAKEVFVGSNDSDQEKAIMPFILWIVGEVEREAVLAQIDSLDRDVVFTWSFGEVREILKRYDSPKREQAELFIGFFEGRISREELEERLRNNALLS